ncbi:hypothetical protein AB0E59_01240 [Lentzea sp. NPDC034063]|uniref:hypothetical protein n=1 Tax=unclassified Lentzea TaxID=2643253 RepID=UPI0033D06310
MTTSASWDLTPNWGGSMVGRKTAGALALAAVALVLGIGAAAAAEDNRDLGTTARG